MGLLIVFLSVLSWSWSFGMGELEKFNTIVYCSMPCLTMISFTIGA